MEIYLYEYSWIFDADQHLGHVVFTWQNLLLVQCFHDQWISCIIPSCLIHFNRWIHYFSWSQARIDTPCNSASQKQLRYRWSFVYVWIFQLLRSISVEALAWCPCNRCSNRIAAMANSSTWVRNSYASDHFC